MTASSLYPEPAIPSGYKAGDWLYRNQICAALQMLGLKGNVSALLNAMVAKGLVQLWKRGPYRYYRNLWKI